MTRLQLNLMTFLLRLPHRTCSQYILHRHYSSKALNPNHSIYVSKSTNPYFNLTYEDWLFRHKNPEEPLLLIYRDEPCVVIGRNQNPWKEVNFNALKARPGVPFIRRRSGGGTVYHDLGNSNFSIHLPRNSFDRHATGQIVLRAIRALGIDACVNDRNDICIGKDKICSAYKIVNKRAYHHGTMLLSTQLKDLGDILRTDKETMITRGVASVRSPVCNIQQYDASINHDAFTNAVVEEFKKEYNIDGEVVHVEETNDLLSVEYIKKGISELQSWEWAYGQTPEFTYTIEQNFPWGEVSAQVVSKHGLILKCIFNVSNSRLSSEHAQMLFKLAKDMGGVRYGCLDGIVIPTSNCSASVDVLAWLRRMMS